MSRLKASLCLLAASMIWGCAFVAQSIASDAVGPCTFNGVRFLIGAVTVSLLMPLLKKISPEDAERTEDPALLWKAGISCGIVLGIASIFQQAGIAWTTAGKAGFITSLYVVLVPVAGLLFHRFPKAHVWIAAGIAVLGLFLLSSPENGTIGKGELLEIMAAVCFTGHILVIDHFSDRVNPAKLSVIQFLVAGILGLIGAVFTEPISISALKQAMIPILYAGVCSAGLGYTLQAYGQKGADPEVASVLLSLESVFSAVFGFLILHETLSVKEVLGCVLMFAAVLISQKTEKDERYKTAE